MSESLFRDFWWLLFPISWFVLGAFRSWMAYRENRETLDLIKSYAASGREPPAELFARLESRRCDDDDDRPRPRRYRRRERGLYQVVLFGIMAAGFGFAAATDMYGDGQAFTIVAFVMAALSAAALVQVIVYPKRPVD